MQITLRLVILSPNTAWAIITMNIGDMLRRTAASERDRASTAMV